VTSILPPATGKCKHGSRMTWRSVCPRCPTSVRSAARHPCLNRVFERTRVKTQAKRSRAERRRRGCSWAAPQQIQPGHAPAPHRTAGGESRQLIASLLGRFTDACSMRRLGHTMEPAAMDADPESGRKPHRLTGIPASRQRPLGLTPEHSVIQDRMTQRSLSLSGAMPLMHQTPGLAAGLL
jgi:hypothetical protein